MRWSRTRIASDPGNPPAATQTSTMTVPERVPPVGRDGSGIGADDLIKLRGPLHRYVAAMVQSEQDVDDIVQETLVRMLQVTRRLEVETLSAYAFTVARNLVFTGARAQATARRHLPRLLDLNEPVRPDESATTAEARHALATALADLPPARRAVLLARDVHRRPLTELADHQQTTPNVLASQLHRTRALLRLDYVLALRRVTLPTPACRPVLLAISGGDRRQQAVLRAGDHLATCRTCADVAPPLVHRDRALAGIVPWLSLGAVHGKLEGLVRRHPRSSVSAAVAAAVLAAAAAAAHSSAPPPATATPTTQPASAVSQTETPTPTETRQAATPAPATSSGPNTGAAPSDAALVAVPAITIAGQPFFAERNHLAALAGRTVTARRVRVLAVPADEGFWVGQDNARVWVQFTGPGESPLQVKVGQRLTFTAEVTANTTTFLAHVGLEPKAGRADLERDGYHLQVDPRTVQLDR